MSGEVSLKKGNFWYVNQKDLKQLESLKTSEKDVEDVRLILRDCTSLREVLKTFQNVKRLEFSIWNYTDDIKKEVQFPHLKNVHFGQVVPMNLRNFWNTFSNLEEASIGNRDNYDLFTSEFVNRVIGRNQWTLKVLRILDVPLVASTYRPLRVPCQLEKLEIIYFREESKDKICRTQEHKKKIYDKQKFMKQPGLKFYTEKEEITSFDNLNEILRSQNELNILILDSAVIDYSLLDIIASKSHIRSLKLLNSELRFNEMSSSMKEFFRKIRNLSISSDHSERSLLEILSSLRDVEVLDISDIWTTEGKAPFKPLETRTILPNLKQLEMYFNCSSNEVLDSLEFTENLEKITADIGNIERAREICRTCPNVSYFNLKSSPEEVVHFVVINFKKLEWFEWTVSNFCFQTVIYVLENASNIRRAKIYLYMDYSREDKAMLDDKLHVDFPGFYFDDRACVLEIHNEELDFKLRIGYHHYMLGGSW